MGLIQSVSLSRQETQLQEKLSPLVGTEPLEIALIEGSRLFGVITELGQDYCVLLPQDSPGQELYLPYASILWLKRRES